MSPKGWVRVRFHNITNYLNIITFCYFISAFSFVICLGSAVYVVSVLDYCSKNVFNVVVENYIKRHLLLFSALLDSLILFCVKLFARV